MKVYVSRYHIILVILTLMFCVMFKSCTTSPSGAIEHRTISYYVDGKFYDELPEEYIFKTWGYRIIDAIGNEHTYRNKVNIPHGRKETKWCTIHRQHEVVKAHFDPKGDGYYYWVNRHKRSF